MRPSIEHIVTFIKVVEHQSFTAAAQKLGVSKSVISKHVTALEEALNIQLIKRSTRKLMITDAGQVFYNHVCEIPERVSSGHNALQPFQEEAKGHLKVLAPATFAASLKIEVIPNFLITCPEVTLELELLPTVEDYVEGDFDIIVMGHLSDTPMPDYNLVAVKLCKIPVGIYATPAYLKKHGKPKTPADLENHNCISSQTGAWPFKEKDGYIYKVPVNGNLVTQSDEVVQAATMKDVGVAYSFPYLFMDALKEKKVVPLLQEYTDIYVELYAVYHPNPYLPMKTRAFVDAMKVHYQAMQDDILEHGKYSS